MASTEMEVYGKELSTMDDEDADASSRSMRSSRGSGKWRGYDSKRVFKKEWLMTYPWLADDPEDPTHALCKLCGKKIRAHKGDIEKHEKTKRHTRKQTTTDILADLIPITDGTNTDRDESGCNTTKYSMEVDTTVGEQSEQFIGPDGSQQIIYFAESTPNSTQQTTNTVIDRLVERYHQTRAKYLKEEHDATTNTNKEKLEILKQRLEGEANQNDVKNTLMNEEHQAKLKYLGIEHAAKLKAINDERDARLRSIEQDLIFAKQEYEKKMQLLDAQLSLVQDTGISSGPKQSSHVQLTTHLNQASLPQNPCLYH